MDEMCVRHDICTQQRRFVEKEKVVLRRTKSFREGQDVLWERQTLCRQWRDILQEGKRRSADLVQEFRG